MRKFYLIILIICAGLLPVAAAAKEEGCYELSTNEDYALWWALDLYKILPDRDNSGLPQKLIEISAGRNEYVSFQLVIYPRHDVSLQDITVTSFKSTKHRFSGRNNAAIFVEECVPVAQPTDELGRPGLWPDPLIPLTASAAQPLALSGKTNHVFWISVYVPEQAGPGLYDATLRIKIADSKLLTEVPIQLRVHNFALPKETHTRTAYGVSINNEWHKLKDKSDFQKVYDLYLQVLARYRICPYNPMEYSPIDIKLTPVKDGERLTDCNVALDFNDFDQTANRYLNKMGFNSFNLPLPLEYEGYKAFDDNYKLIARKVLAAEIAHLKEKGWLDKAYCYWMDEPDANHIPLAYVQDGLKFLKEEAPGLKRLLTFSQGSVPDSRYFDLVNLWVPLLSCLNPGLAQERQMKGEEIWWYVCCGPHAPYPNNFIDHPAINQRIRYWMMERYNIQGDLYWSATYWAYRNPYEDPASYINDKKQESFGNGDGVLLYPPTMTRPTGPLIAAPNPSIRLELIRAGLQDREYFWLLRQEIERLKAPTYSAQVKDLVGEAEVLLQEPGNLIKSRKDFETDPMKLYQARHRIAQMIDRLRQIQ